jgi:flagellar export protein FliJ
MPLSIQLQMRRFRFPLQTVLRLRGQLERLSRRTLAAAMASVNEAERRLQFAAHGLSECADHAQGRSPAAPLARALETGLRRNHLRAQNELRAAEANAESARADYLQRRQDLRSLERLRERRHEEWQTETNRAEQAELDELARLARAARGEVEA